MKKSVIALCLSSALFVAGCNDEQFAQKLLEAEKKIVQLQTDYQQSQTQLAQTESQLAKLQQFKAETEKNQQAFPALQVEIVPLFNKSTVVKHTPQQPKDKSAANHEMDEYFREETPVVVFASTAKTGVEWLDHLLLLNMLNEKERAKFTDKNAAEKAVIAQFEQHYQEQLQSAKENQEIGLEYSLATTYFGQRNNIATFTQMNYAYTGGAHGSHYTNYLNVDVNKKAVIRLADLVPPENQAKLLDLLWENYRNDRRDENGNFVGFVEKKDFFVSDQFYFTPNGIRFVYPLYSIGSYAEGEVEISTHFYEINPLLNPEYQRTKKDGFEFLPTN